MFDVWPHCGRWIGRQCLCCYTYCALPTDDEVPCGCACCGNKFKGEWVDPNAYKGVPGAPSAHQMQRDAQMYPEGTAANMGSSYAPMSGV